MYSRENEGTYLSALFLLVYSISVDLFPARISNFSSSWEKLSAQIETSVLNMFLSAGLSSNNCSCRVSCS